MNRICGVYILTNQNNTVLYTGVTIDLEKRISEHTEKIDPRSFTARYNINKLVYFEEKETIVDAITREKQIKAGSRKKKVTLIETMNHNWEDLSADLFG